MLLISKQRELNMKERFSVTVADEELADFAKPFYDKSRKFQWLLFSHFVLELSGQSIVQS